MLRSILLAITALTLSWYPAGAQHAARSHESSTQHRAPQAAAVDTVEHSDVAVALPDQAAAGSADVSEAVDTAPKKKGGLFGKAKGLMKNKVVQTVAKTAACTMVPGGQALAGAIDAASSRNAGEGATSVAGAATGSGCMPGMPGAGLLGAAASRSAGPGMAGLVYPGLASVAGGTMPPTASGYAPAAEPVAGEQSMAECMGLTMEEYTALTNPTNGEVRPLTKAEQKRIQKIAKKLDPARQTACLQTGTAGAAPDRTR